MDELKEVLSEAIKSSIESLDSLTPGSKERHSAVEDIEKLYRLTIDDAKVESENTKNQNQYLLEATKEASQEVQEKFKREEDRRSMFIGLAATVVMALTEIGFTSYWLRKGFQFETEGTYTSGTLRSFANRIRLFGRRN